MIHASSPVSLTIFSLMCGLSPFSVSLLSLVGDVVTHHRGNNVPRARVEYVRLDPLGLRLNRVFIVLYINHIEIFPERR